MNSLNLGADFEKVIADEMKAAAEEKRYKDHMARIESRPCMRNYHVTKKELTYRSEEMAQQLRLKRQREKEEAHKREMLQQQSFRRLLAKEEAVKARQREAVEQSIIEKKERSEVTQRLREEILGAMALKTIQFKAIGEQKDKLSRLRIQSLEEERQEKIKSRRDAYERRLNRAKELKQQQKLEVNRNHAASS